MTPNSTKSTQQKLRENVTDTTDRVARYADAFSFLIGFDLTLCPVELNLVPVNPQARSCLTRASGLVIVAETLKICIDSCSVLPRSWANGWQRKQSKGRKPPIEGNPIYRSRFHLRWRLERDTRQHESSGLRPFWLVHNFSSSGFTFAIQVLSWGKLMRKP